MRLLNQLIIFISLFIFSLPVFAAEVKPIELSLHDAVMLALRKNPNVQSAEIQRIVDKMNLRAAEWAYEWQYTLTGSSTHSDSVSGGTSHSESDTTSFTSGATLLTPIGASLNVSMTNPLNHTAGHARFYNPGITFKVTQPLLQGSRRDIVLAPLHSAENAELLARLTLKSAIMQVITDVISQYVALVQAENSLKTQNIQLQNTIDILKQQQAFLKTGRIAPADLVQFQSSVASQQLSVQQQEVSLSQQKRKLLITLGIDPSTTIKLSSTVRFPDETIPTLAESIELALKNNITYQQQLLGVKQTKIALALAVDNARWQLSFVAQRTQGGGSGAYPNTGLESLSNGANTNTQFTFNLTVPIDNLTLEKAVTSAKVALRQAYINLNSQRHQVILTITNDCNTVLNQRAQIKQAETAVKLAQQTLDIAQAKLKFGKVSPFEVSTLQSTLITQKISAINAITAYMTNLATLDQDTGVTLDRWKVELRY